MKKIGFVVAGFVSVIVAALFLLWSQTMFIPNQGATKAISASLQGEKISAEASLCLNRSFVPPASPSIDLEDGNQQWHFFATISACEAMIGGIFTEAKSEADIGLPGWMGISRTKFDDSVKRQLIGFDANFKDHVDHAFLDLTANDPTKRLASRFILSSYVGAYALQNNRITQGR